MSSLNSLEINKIKAEYNSKIRLENQKLLLKTKSLIEENNNLTEKVIEEFNKNKSLVEKNNNLKKMIKEDINKKVKHSK